MKSIEKSIVSLIDKYRRTYSKSPSVLLVPQVDLYDLENSFHFNEKEGTIFGLKVAVWYDPVYYRMQVL
jgi:hypothetical protein